MKNMVFRLGLFVFASLFFTISACKNKKPSILKVYVRSSNNELLSGAKVIVIGDVSSDPPTKEYVDTVQSNNAGFAEINMQPYYDMLGDKEDPIGYFDVVAKKDNKEGSGKIRCRGHITNVLTVMLNP